MAIQTGAQNDARGDAFTSSSASLGSVIVTGGCGMLGSHLVNLLHERHPKSSISVLDISTERNRHASPAIKYYDGDITSTTSVRAIFHEVRPDVVIHTASPPLAGTKSTQHVLFERVNVGGTGVLLEVAKETGVKAFVYTSSASVISDNESDLVNADERWPVVPKALQTEFYSVTKAEAEALVIAANRQGGMLTTALRPAGIIGERDGQTVARMYDAYKTGKTGFQLGENNNIFDFTYVVNVAHAHLLAAVALLNAHRANTPLPEERKVEGEAFFITNDQPTYFWDFSRAVWKVAGDKKSIHPTIIPQNVGLPLASVVEWVFWMLRKEPSLNRRMVRYSCMTRYYNIGKAKDRLGYKPIVSLPEGIERTVKWFVEQDEKLSGSVKKIQ